MFTNATISSRSSSSKSANSCSRNSSMPSLRMRNPLTPKTSYNPLFRHSDQLTSFDASHFIFQESKRSKGRNPVLRRYNSHDSSANFDDSKNESKDNTPESTKSRMSDSSAEKKKCHEYEARDFLERYSLPRVVRVGGGEPLLLYRCFDSFTKIQARGVLGRKGREKTDNHVLHFPEGYTGWFSLTNEKGEKSAIIHTSILQLVREQVCSFMSMQPFTAYATQTADMSENGSKVQYLKTQVRGGQLFQLRAVFQHKERPDGGKNSTRSSRISRSAKDKDLANRYAQLISQNNQELYVPLTVKGEFYEIHSSMKARLCFPGMLDKTGPLALDKDCLYKITHLLRRVALPVKVKLITGPLPHGLPKDFTDTFILEHKFQEPLMVTCTLPPPNQDQIEHQISCVNLNSNLKISKNTLGFDSENRLFKSQRLQAALAFCHKNVESWYREVRIAPINFHDEKVDKPRETSPAPPLVVSLESNENRCPDCDKVMSSEDCCKNFNDNTKQIITKEVLEKFPKPKKWYKHFKLLGSKEETPPFSNEQVKDPMDGMDRGKSIERYKDMSKLIEEKFGKKGYNPVKKSASFMFSTKRIDLEETDRSNNPALLKCQSLDTQLYSIEESHHHHHKHHQQQTKELSKSRSNISDDLSYDFRMCILENDSSDIKKVDEIVKVEDFGPKLRKTKPDLIPTLPKNDPDSYSPSYITERLCSEFHVKTKVQITKRGTKLNDFNRSSSARFQSHTRLSLYDLNSPIDDDDDNKRVIVQIHNGAADDLSKKSSSTGLLVDEIPYSHVADDESATRKSSESENIYAEICEDNVANNLGPCSNSHCDSARLCCDCAKRDPMRTRKNEYCYVKLGSNGDSVTQSDSDEAIYNTLR